MNTEPHEFMRFGAGADFRHSCAECPMPRHHPIHGFSEEGMEREPQMLPVHNEPPTADSVRRCYTDLIDVLDEFNEMMPEGDRVVVAFTLQHVLAQYIAEQEAIASLTRDWKPLGEDVSGHTMMGPYFHDDGRDCSFHARLNAWTFENTKQCLRPHPGA